MLNRRMFLGGAATLPMFSSGANAQVKPEDIPFEAGQADFAGVWSLADGSISALVSDPPDLPKGDAKRLGQVIFSSSDEIDNFFKAETGYEFVTWFNSKLAGKKSWANKKIRGADVSKNFSSYWDAYLRDEPRTAMEFLAYMAVHINEVDGNLKNRGESYGHKDHPGIAYLFNKVTLKTNGRTWTKASYNTGRANIDCFQLFNSKEFNDAHEGKPLGSLARTSDRVWSGSRYPAGLPTAGRQDETGYVLEADFYKFRGRGIIQTTWRSNYEKIVDYIKEYSGSSEVLIKYREKWTNLDKKTVCTVSSNSDWDEIFDDKTKEILTIAVKIHAKGSIVSMGDGIGGSGYGKRLKARMNEMCLALRQ